MESGRLGPLDGTVMGVPGSSRPDYYRDLIDLEALDRRHPASSQRGGFSQLSFVSELLRSQRLDLVQEVLTRRLLGRELEAVVAGALEAVRKLYRRLAGLTGDYLQMSPKALGLAELALWRPELRERLEEMMLVEIPVERDWKRRGINKKSEESVLGFYRETESYIFELMAANNLVQTLYNYIVTLRKMKNLGIASFLDYGAGIGTFVILGIESGFKVQHMDLHSKTTDFAEWRYRERGLNVPILFARGDHSDVRGDNAIVCTEVIEHVFEPLKLLDAFREAVPVGGHVIVSESCDYTEQFVSHLETNKWLGGSKFDDEMKGRGFEEVLPEPRVHPRVFMRIW